MFGKSFAICTEWLAHWGAAYLSHKNDNRAGHRAATHRLENTADARAVADSEEDKARKHDTTSNLADEIRALVEVLRPHS